MSPVETSYLVLVLVGLIGFASTLACYAAFRNDQIGRMRRSPIDREG